MDIIKTTLTFISRCGEVVRRRSLGRGKGSFERNALACVSRDFSELKVRMEPGFVELGKTLRELHATAGQLTDAVRARAESLRGALVESRLAGEDGLASICNQQLTSKLDQTASLLNSLSHVEELLRRFQGQVEGVQRIGLLLKVCTLNLAVESVRTAACRDAFGAFVGELRELAGRITQLGQGIHSEVEKTQQAQAAGVQAMAAGIKQMRALALDLQAKSAVTAAEAQQMLDASCAMLQETEACALAVSKHAQEAVFHLQFGDIIRQKAEHISDSFNEAVGLLTRADPKNYSENRVLAGGVVAVQIGQMESINREIREACNQLRGAFEGISKGSQHFAACFKQHGHSDHSNTGMEPLQALLGDAESTDRLQQEVSCLSRQARVAAQAAMESLGRLSLIVQQVKAINHDMHLQALNAIIKTAALGTGGVTLEVLAVEVDRLFLQSNEVVAHIAATLEEILACARAMLDRNQDTSAELQPEALGLRAGLQQIERAYSQFAETASEVQSLALSQQEQLTAGQSRLAFLPALAEALQAQTLELDVIQHGLLPEGHHPATVHSARLEDLSARYTMASEREIHSQVFGLKSSPTEAAPDYSKILPPEENESPAGGSLTESERSPDQERGRQPLVASVASATPGPSDLGDNVELF